MKLIPVLLLSLLVLPCNAADKAKKKEALLSQQAVTAHSIDEAITKTSPVPLAPGKKIKRPITLENPVLETDGRRVLYDLYSMPALSGQRFELKIWSYCKCFGFDKTIIVPTTVVMINGKSLATQNQSVEKQAAGLTPLHQETTIEGTFDGDGTAYILLYGDTGNVGSTVTEARGGSSFVGATGTYINIGDFAITKSPVGTIAIELKAN
jgi:hypothetical protein